MEVSYRSHSFITSLTKENPLHFGDDLDYNPDPGSGFLIYDPDLAVEVCSL